MRILPFCPEAHGKGGSRNSCLRILVVFQIRCSQPSFPRVLLPKSHKQLASVLFRCWAIYMFTYHLCLYRYLCPYPYLHPFSRRPSKEAYPQQVLLTVRNPLFNAGELANDWRLLTRPLAHRPHNLGCINELKLNSIIQELCYLLYILLW